MPGESYNHMKSLPEIMTSPMFHVDMCNVSKEVERASLLVIMTSPMFDAEMCKLSKEAA